MKLVSRPSDSANFFQTARLFFTASENEREGNPHYTLRVGTVAMAFLKREKETRVLPATAGEGTM